MYIYDTASIFRIHNGREIDLLASKIKRKSTSTLPNCSHFLYFCYGGFEVTHLRLDLGKVLNICYTNALTVKCYASY